MIEYMKFWFIKGLTELITTVVVLALMIFGAFILVVIDGWRERKATQKHKP